MSNIYIKKVTENYQDHYGRPTPLNHEEYFDLRPEPIEAWIKENFDVKDDLLDSLEYHRSGIFKVSLISLMELGGAMGQGIISFCIPHHEGDPHIVIGLKLESVVSYKEAWKPIVEKLHNYMCDCILGKTNE